MIGRLWVKAVAPIHSGRHRIIKNSQAIHIERFKFVWMTRSASQVSEILPDILLRWNLLVEKWGLENAQKVCNISVYVTDENKPSCALLLKEYENTDFFRNGGIVFQRPDIAKVVADHTIELINSRASSHSLLAFCGSQSLANEIHYCKISNDVITAMTGHCQSHTMDYISESYGGNKTASKIEEPTKKGSFSLEIDENFKLVDYDYKSRGNISESQIIFKDDFNSNIIKTPIKKFSISNTNLEINLNKRENNLLMFDGLYSLGKSENKKFKISHDLKKISPKYFIDFDP